VDVDVDLNQYDPHPLHTAYILDIYCCVIDCNYPTCWLLHTTGMAHLKNRV